MRHEPLLDLVVRACLVTRDADLRAADALLGATLARIGQAIESLANVESFTGECPVNRGPLATPRAIARARKSLDRARSELAHYHGGPHDGGKSRRWSTVMLESLAEHPEIARHLCPHCTAELLNAVGDTKGGNLWEARAVRNAARRLSPAPAFANPDTQ